jgi:hypothetical protein
MRALLAEDKRANANVKSDIWCRKSNLLLVGNNGKMPQQQLVSVRRLQTSLGKRHFGWTSVRITGRLRRTCDGGVGKWYVRRRWTLSLVFGGYNHEIAKVNEIRIDFRKPCNKPFSLTFMDRIYAASLRFCNKPVYHSQCIWITNRSFKCMCS